MVGLGMESVGVCSGKNRDQVPRNRLGQQVSGADLLQLCCLKHPSCLRHQNIARRLSISIPCWEGISTCVDSEQRQISQLRARMEQLPDKEVGTCPIGLLITICSRPRCLPQGG